MAPTIHKATKSGNSPDGVSLIVVYTCVAGFSILLLIVVVVLCCKISNKTREDAREVPVEAVVATIQLAEVRLVGLDDTKNKI
jgi:hypothetical protein